MFGYFGAKHAAEEAIVEDSGIPWTNLRATQFYDLSLTTAQAMAKLPVLPVPAGFRFQPIEAGEVADRLVELALGRPAALCPPLAGRESTTGPISFADICGRLASVARSSVSPSSARLPPRSGRARTWLPTAPSAGGPGRTSWPSGWDAMPPRPSRSGKPDSAAARNDA